jgi:hypothetical protein
MLSAINQGPCFTGAKYNVLRVIAAFPQLAKFSTTSKAVATTLRNNNHPIAIMREDRLVESLAREPEITEILTTLMIRHKRAKDGDDIDDKVPASKRKK